MKIFKKLAAYVVTAYARYLYSKARKTADEMYRKKPQMYYVASGVFQPNRLTIYDKRRFKIEKSVFGRAAELKTLIELKNGCYYHTPDTAGNQAMTEHEIEVARRFFIKERLEKAKLI